MSFSDKSAYFFHSLASLLKILRHHVTELYNSADLGIDHFDRYCP